MRYKKIFISCLAVCLILCISGTAFSVEPELGSFYTQKNKGTKSMIWAKAPAGVAYTTVQHLAEGMNKAIGRCEFLVLEMERRGVQLVVVPDGSNIYDVPEWSHLKSQNPTDGLTRIVIPGTVENPIIVTRESDVLRKREAGDYNPDRYEFFYHFAKLFFEIGVKSGAMKTPRSSVEPIDTYNYYKRMREAYANAKANNLWPGTKMMDSVEEYFAEGSMIYFEVTPESVDGSWTRDAGPVNRRKEMIVYDEMLFECMVEIYGEYEYLTPYLSGNSPGPEPGNQMPAADANYKPWYMNRQADRYGPDGRALQPIMIEKSSLISHNYINILFNRDPDYNADYFNSNSDVGELRKSASYKVTWLKPDGSTQNIPVTYRRFLYRTASLQFTAPAGLFDGAMGLQFQGFTAEELADLRTKYPYMQRDVSADVGPNSINRGEYIDKSRMTNKINGTLIVEVLADVNDWSGNALTGRSAVVQVSPWLAQVYRSPKAGVYIYADEAVRRESMEMAGKYIDEFFLNPVYGHRFSNGLIRENRGLSIVAYRNSAYQQPQLISAYTGNNEHQYLYAEGFGGGIAQTSESGVWRDKRTTRYKHEWLLAHEFGHSTDSAFNRYCSWEELQADGINPMNRGLSVSMLRRVIRDDGVAKGLFAGTYMGGWENGVEKTGTAIYSEYISKGNTKWWSCDRESVDGTNNGTWGPINTRDELYRYYPECYEFFKTIYYNGSSTDDNVIRFEKNFIGTPWESYTNSNIYNTDGSMYPEAIPEPMPEGTPEGVFRTADVTVRNLSDVSAEEKQAEMDYIAAETGFSAGSLAVDNSGHVAVKPEIFEAVAAGSSLELERLTALPVVQSIFSVAGGSAGDVIAFCVDASGEELLVSNAAEVSLMALTSEAAGGFFTRVSEPAQFGDKTFALLNAEGGIVTGAIDRNGQYQLLVMMSDGGEFDLNSLSDSVVVGAFALVEAADIIIEPPVEPGGSSGCSAAGYLPVVLAALLFVRKKR